MANELFNRGFQVTVPDDTNDPPQFSQGIETTKDTLVLELRKFFEEKAERVSELPTIEKYNVPTDSTDPLETVVQVLRKNPGVLERLPHIMVMATQGRQLPMSIGTPLLAAVQDAPRIVSTLAEPYNLAYPGISPPIDGQTLAIMTQPGMGSKPVKTSTYQFLASRFADITAATAAEVAEAINEQALYAQASVVPVGGGNGVQLETGGPYGKAMPNQIEVLSTSAPWVVAAFGFAKTGGGASCVLGGTAPNLTLTDPAGTFAAGDVGKYLVVKGSTTPFYNDGRFLITAVTSATQLTFTSRYGVPESFNAGTTYFIGARDDAFNPARPPKNRYVYAWDLTAQIEIVAPAGGDQIRTELMDLVGSFFTFWLEEKYFTFLGRSVADPVVPSAVGQSESYQIVLKSDASITGENEVPRPDDSKDKLQINGYSLNVHTTMYLDRDVLRVGGPNVGTPWTVESTDFTEDDTLPQPS